MFMKRRWLIDLCLSLLLVARVYSRVFQVSALAVMFVLLGAHEVLSLTSLGDGFSDGRADLVFAYNAGGVLHVRTALATPAGTFAATIDSDFGDGAGVLNERVFAVDANGDGRADLVFVYKIRGVLHMRTALATPAGTFAATIDSDFGDGAGVLSGRVFAASAYTPIMAQDMTGGFHMVPVPQADPRPPLPPTLECGINNIDNCDQLCRNHGGPKSCYCWTRIVFACTDERCKCNDNTILDNQGEVCGNDGPVQPSPPPTAAVTTVTFRNKTDYILYGYSAVAPRNYDLWCTDLQPVGRSIWPNDEYTVLVPAGQQAWVKFMRQTRDQGCGWRYLKSEHRPLVYPSPQPLPIIVDITGP